MNIINFFHAVSDIIFNIIKCYCSISLMILGTIVGTSIVMFVCFYCYLFSAVIFISFIFL